MTTPDIQFTQAAANKIFSSLVRSERAYFRVKIQGGGCMGFEFVFGVDDHQSKNDFVWHAKAGQKSFACVCDFTTYAYLKGATIDFLSDANGERFSILSDYAQTCSCNKSFAITHDNR